MYTFSIKEQNNDSYDSDFLILAKGIPLYEHNKRVFYVYAEEQGG